MMKNVELEDSDWNEVVQRCAAPVVQAAVQADPLLRKITSQLAAQTQPTGNSHAAERLGQRPDKGALSPRDAAAVAPADRRDSPQQRASGQTPRR